MSCMQTSIVYTCITASCVIFLLLQRYGEERGEEEATYRGGDVHSREVQGDEEESGGRPVTRRACTHDTGSNKDEQIWDMIYF